MDQKRNQELALLPRFDTTKTRFRRFNLDSSQFCVDLSDGNDNLDARPITKPSDCAQCFTFRPNFVTSNATMTDPLPSFDLRLTPDWLKEPEPANRYADYEGDESQDRHQRGRRERRDERPRRSSAPNDRSRREPSERRAVTNNRPVQAATQRSGEGGGPKPPRSDRPRFQRREDQAARPEVEPAPVQIDFLPEERSFSKIIQQIKQGHVAYPLFGLARMFLERPERHRVRVRSLDNHTMVYQFGDHGPVAMDPAALERSAFNEKKDEFYETQIIEKEPIKGNFTSVARCTLTGKILGPTNYHAFQPALRALYEQRFSRRMSFDDYRRAIEITSEAQIVEQWKEEARKAVTFRTRDQENPVVFDNLAGVEQHFRTHHLPGLIRPCLATELSGETARHLPDRGIIAAIRKARDRENRFPAQIAGALRHGLNHAGLHVFKHKKRILYISTVRPQLFDPNQASVSSSLSAILSAIKSYPKISRKQLAEKVLNKLTGEHSADEASPEYQQAKTALATDLIWLAKAGHVIEFADGTLDLPLPPKPAESGRGSTHPSAQQSLETEKAGHSSDDESESAPLKAEEIQTCPEGGLSPAVAEVRASGISGEDPVVHTESAHESTDQEVALRPSLDPPDGSELVEAVREPLET
jgi:hypothetical protein